MISIKRLTKYGLVPAIAGLAIASLFAIGSRPASQGEASSHREAPLISGDPKADATDTYVYISKDAPNMATFVGNWIPLEEPAGGPNFYNFGDDVYYDFVIDNNGDAKPDIRYRFTFKTEIQDPTTFLYATGPITSLDDPNFNFRQFYDVQKKVGDGDFVTIASHLAAPPNNIGPVSTPSYDTLAAQAVYSLPGGGKVFAGQRDDPFFVDLGSLFDLATIRKLPGDTGGGVDGVGGFNTNSIVFQVPISDVTGCGCDGTESAAAPSARKADNNQGNNGKRNHGQGNNNAGVANQSDDNQGDDNEGDDNEGDEHSPTAVPTQTVAHSQTAVTSRTATGSRTAQPSKTAAAATRTPEATHTATHTPDATPTASATPPKPDLVIGVWTETMRQSTKVFQIDGEQANSGSLRQVSRLGNPLVNEVVIPLSDKDKFNASKPADDLQFLPFVLNSDLAAKLNAVYSLGLPTTGRTDLVTVFLTGIPGLNQPVNVVPSEQLRINLGIKPSDCATTSTLGVIAGDNCGFPNGRRLGDDSTDIELRAVACGYGFDFGPCSNSAPYAPTTRRLGDGVDGNDKPFLASFPYVASPHQGFQHEHHTGVVFPAVAGFGAAAVVLGLLVLGSQAVSRIRRRREGVTGE